MVIKDVRLCTDLGPAGATCVTTLSGKTQDIPPLQWDDERIGQICMTADSYGMFKKAIEELCHENPDLCVYENEQQMQRAFHNMSAMRKRSTSLLEKTHPVN